MCKHWCLMNYWLSFLLLTLTTWSESSLSASWDASWWAKGSDAVIAMSSNRNNPERGMNTFVLIGYKKQFGCEPTVAVLSIKGVHLGKPYEQVTSKKSKNQLIVNVGGRDFKPSITKMNKYSNGIEFVTFAEADLIRALSDENRTLSARIGDKTLIEFRRANGFVAANRRASINCD